LSFPYVCPEPVLVKRSHLYANGSKRPFSHTSQPSLMNRLRGNLPRKASRSFLLNRSAITCETHRKTSQNLVRNNQVRVYYGWVRHLFVQG
jgi:hypothetical protein